MDIHTDLYGAALLDYYLGNYTDDITVLSPTMEDDVLPLPYLFRDHDAMPQLEKAALQFAKGTTLDIGAGAGSHSLYLESQGIEVTAIDQSPGACNVLKQRLKLATTVINDSVWNHHLQYDTLLMLMNGTGIFETVSHMQARLEHLKTLLKPNGQLLIDSSDIQFLFEQDSDGGIWVDAGSSYYGEVQFSLAYKGSMSPPFKWLYVDFKTFKEIATRAGFKATIIAHGEHHDYLAKLTVIK